MDSTAFNEQLNDLRNERVRLEKRLQHVEDTISALMAMQKSSQATKATVLDRVYGG